ncbi:MAG: YncE family protein [Halothiobacillaceae bacterium]
MQAPSVAAENDTPGQETPWTGLHVLSNTTAFDICSIELEQGETQSPHGLDMNGTSPWKSKAASQYPPASPSAEQPRQVVNHASRQLGLPPGCLTASPSCGWPARRVPNPGSPPPQNGAGRWPQRQHSLFPIVAIKEHEHAPTCPGSHPAHPGLASAAPFAYITNGGDNTVSVIDTATNAVTATVAVGSQPDGVAVSPDGTRVYVANYIDGTVSVIDTATNAVVDTVTVGNGPIAFGAFIGPAASAPPAPSAPVTIPTLSAWAMLLLAALLAGLGLWRRQTTA